MMRPFSKRGRRRSCLSLFSLWISSIIRTIPLYSLASSTTISKSFLLFITAFRHRYLQPSSFTKQRAMVVFPIPGLPYKIIENSLLFLTRLFSIFPSPTRCFWPTTSFNFWGFIANGSFIFITFFIIKYFFKNVNITGKSLFFLL